MSPTWKAAIGVILIFILGWFGGALTTLGLTRHKALVLMQRSPEAIAFLLERQTTRNLRLNENQRTQFHSLIFENVRERMELQKQIQPQIMAVNRQTMQDIDALLTPDQQQRFQENLVLFKDRFGRNPFNVGSNDKSAAPTTNLPSDVGAGTNAPAASK